MIINNHIFNFFVCSNSIIHIFVWFITLFLCCGGQSSWATDSSTIGLFFGCAMQIKTTIIQNALQEEGEGGGCLWWNFRMRFSRIGDWETSIGTYIQHQLIQMAKSLISEWTNKCTHRHTHKHASRRLMLQNLIGIDLEHEPPPNENLSLNYLYDCCSTVGEKEKYKEWKGKNHISVG